MIKKPVKIFVLIKLSRENQNHETLK